MITEEFLKLEILISPETYNIINTYGKEDIKNLINNISKFKNINNTLILLNNEILNLFNNENIDNLINSYGNFNFIEYYIGNIPLYVNNEYDEYTENLEELERLINLENNDTNNNTNNTNNTNNKENTKSESINNYGVNTTIENINELTPDKIFDERLAKLEKERIERLKEIRTIRNSIFNKINYYSKDVETNIKIYDKWDVSGKSTCEGSLNDFINYFKNRYSKIKTMIERKVNKKGYPLNKIYKMKNEKGVFVVGIVSDIATTKKGHKRIEIEDEETTFTVIILKDKIEKGDIPDDILLDEVIGFEGTISQDGGVMFPDSCIRPDITPKPPKCIDEKIYTAFLSDVHIGSYEFLGKEFKKFIELLNGKTTNALEEKVASRLKYISIAGDLVDGVGIYPGQEYDLYDVDILSQYKEVVAYIEQIPEHIDIIISPGNHDALRPAEPQPIFPKRILNLFKDLNNVHFVSNPGFVNIHGLDFLLYHGRSFDDIIGQVSSASYQNPASIMKELLKRRHLCPTYGGRCPIAPEEEDYLVIHNEPDVFHTGHIHINGYGIYKGTTLINSGTFQEQTDFQKRMGIHPTPAKIPILDLSKNGSQMIEWNNGKINVFEY